MKRILLVHSLKGTFWPHSSATFREPKRYPWGLPETHLSWNWKPALRSGKGRLHNLLSVLPTHFTVYLQVGLPYVHGALPCCLQPSLLSKISSELYCFLNEYKLENNKGFRVLKKKKKKEKKERRHWELRDDLETRLQNGRQNRGHQQRYLAQ